MTHTRLGARCWSCKATPCRFDDEQLAHGTAAGYQHRCRCEPCRAAYAVSRGMKPPAHPYDDGIVDPVVVDRVAPAASTNRRSTRHDRADTPARNDARPTTGSRCSHGTDVATADTSPAAVDDNRSAATPSSATVVDLVIVVFDPAAQPVVSVSSDVR